jgi:hypothetical protein
MPVLIFPLWLSFNSRVIAEIVLLELGISFFMNVFTRQFMGYGPKQILKSIKIFLKAALSRGFNLENGCGRSPVQVYSSMANKSQTPEKITTTKAKPS